MCLTRTKTLGGHCEKSVKGEGWRKGIRKKGLTLTGFTWTLTALSFHSPETEEEKNIH